MLLLSLIPLPASLAGDIASNTAALLSDFSPLLTLIMGVLLAVLAMSFLVGMLHK